jgi:hypothetical protein
MSPGVMEVWANKALHASKTLVTTTDLDKTMGWLPAVNFAFIGFPAVISSTQKRKGLMGTKADES